MKDRSAQRRLDTRAYRLLLLAFPKRLRERHGASLLDLYQDLYATQESASGLRTWRRVAADALRHGFAARWEQLPGGPTMYLEQLAQDLRIAARGLAQSPGFAAVAILTLGVAIGANTVIFSLVNAVLLRPLPFPEPQQLVRVYGADLEDGDRYGQVSSPDIIDVRDQSRSFAAISMVDSREPILRSEDGAERVSMRYVHASYFPLLGVAPALGRLFTAEEEAPGDSLVLVITDGLWRRAFGADPAIVGRPIDLDGRAFRIIGVLPAWYDEVRLDFEGVEVEMYRPWPLLAEDLFRSGRSMVAIGRLAPGITLEAAQAEVDAIYAGLIELYPEENAGNALALVPLRESIVGTARPALLMLWAAVGVLLLIGCVNLANLLLARAADRRSEVALRAALGAGRGRIVRQLLAESLLIALLGGGLGTGLAALGIDALMAAAGDIVPRVHDVPIDRAAIGFALLLSLTTAVLFGLAPALRAGRADLGVMLKGHDRAATAGRRGRRKLNGLVVAEVAAAVVLLAGAGLFARSLVNLMGVEPGIDSSDALATTLYPVWRDYADADGTLPAGALEALYREIMDRIGSHPGVGAVGVTSILPMSGSYSCDGFWPDDRPLPGPGEGECAETRIVLGDYFEAMGIRLLQGRALDARDRADAQPVVVINEALARRYWPGQDAIGKSLTSVHGGEPRQIVGVVQDVREFGPAQAAPLHIYIAYPQDPWGVVSLTLVVRGGAPLGDPRGDLQLGGEPHRRNGPEAGAPSTAASVAGRATGTSSPASDAGIAAAVRAIIREVDEDIAVDEIVPLRQVVSGAVAEERFRALLLGLFATTAILLAVIGLYGVLATIVGRRTREMGIRAALGARPTALFGLVVAEGLLLATLGLGLGLLGAVAAGRALSGFLFGVTPLDLPTYLAVSALVLGVALVASSIPACRVTRIDPTDALRRS